MARGRRTLKTQMVETRTVATQMVATFALWKETTQTEEESSTVEDLMDLLAVVMER
jgi:hypothetical protein